MEGLHNLLFLGGIVATIYAAGRGIGNDGRTWPFGIQEGLMLGLSAASYAVTSKAIRQGNRFGFSPIVEVAVLFAGIFITMIPALLILNAKGPSLGVNSPAEFFWATGVLSSFLDNAPTYLTFAAMACGLFGVPLEGRYLGALLEHGSGEETATILAAMLVLVALVDGASHAARRVLTR